MNNQINQYQHRLFNTLFATLPSVKKVTDFNKEFNIDVEVNHFYYFKNKDFWFTKYEKDDKCLFLFGIRDKPVKDIGGNDICLIIDFDNNIQFNNDCLGLFSIKNSEIHILINYNILKERYPYINTFDLKITNIKSVDNSLDLEVIDLGDLNNDFIYNLEKLIKSSFVLKSKSNNSSINKNKYINSNNHKETDVHCKICFKNKNYFKIDSRLKNLNNIRPELCGKCIEKIFVSEFSSKINPLVNGNNIKELNIAKEKFGNDQLFDIGLEFLEKYGIMRYVGVERQYFTIDKGSYLVKKFIKYSNKNNLLINNISPINESKPKNKLIKDEIEGSIFSDNSENNSTEKQMEIVLEAISNGKSRKEAAELANIPRYKILHWYNEGKQGNKPENIFFFKRLRELESINKTKNNLDDILNELKNGKYVYQLGLVRYEINNWIEKGKLGVIPYDYFYKEYNLIMESQIKEYENKEINRKIFLENIKAGKTKEVSAKNADINLSLICNWYFKGKEQEEPFVEFYNECSDIKNDNKQHIPKIVKTDSFGNKNIIGQMNKILEYLARGKSEDEALRHVNVSKSTYKYWINRGKQEFGELYVNFYSYVNQIQYEIYDDAELWEESPESNSIDSDIYAPLPNEYEKSFIHTPMNQTGIAWVNKSGNNWIYNKQVNGKTIRFVDENIYELHRKVKNENHVWGIRDYNRAKNIIDIPDDFEVPSKSLVEEITPNVPSVIDQDIYSPLPEEYEQQFNSASDNKTGIAWVNKVGNNWIYAKQIDGKVLRFVDEDIYELHRKVKNENHVWGIRDYNRAKNIIDIPDDFEVPSKSPVEKISPNVPTVIDPDIYSPLPKEYEQQFNSAPDNKTGIAWVSHVGKKWIYQRNINKNKIYFTDESIYALHQKVKENNLTWGIKDYNKARKIIDFPKDFVTHETDEESIEISLDILTPLPKKYLSTFNPNQKNKTGIAWVNKVGNKWVYQRRVNKEDVKFSEYDIHKLHERVINNNQIWGIIDFDKAKPIIDSNQIKEEESEIQITPKPMDGADVVVNYIYKQINDVDVIIKGIIQSTDLIEILNRLKFFENNIKRIITTSRDNSVDIFIELEINKYLKKSFEERIEDLGWNINE